MERGGGEVGRSLFTVFGLHYRFRAGRIRLALLRHIAEPGPSHYFAHVSLNEQLIRVSQSIL